MTIVKQELRQGWKNLAIWTGAIGFFMVVCVLLFPQMKTQAEDMSEAFASMGAFTAAFGMDRLNFGTLIGFYGIECGNVVGIGGGLFAAMIGIAALSKEERDHTAEFLLTHPIRRSRVLTEKLAALLIQVLLLNALVLLLSFGSMAVIGEEIPWREVGLMHLAFLLMQVELVCVCFGLSAFLRRSSVGIGLGLAIGTYFMNLLANLSEDLELLKYLTPYGYTEAAEIVTEQCLDGEKVLIGMGLAGIGVAAAYIKYIRKDIH